LVPPDEFESRVELTPDECIIDERIFFIRGHIELPISETGNNFVWSVWCSLSDASHRHMTERWDDPGRAGDSYFGWLSTRIPGYPETLHLKTDVISRAPGVVPLVRVQKCDHPLYREQETGLTLEEVHLKVHQLLHEHAS
jgi:hypothetical protein